MLFLIFTIIVSNRALSQSHLAFDPTILQTRVDQIKDRIKNQRAQDQELIKWGNEILANNRLKLSQGQDDLTPIPGEIRSAQEREAARSNNCIENNPFERLYIEANNLCDFETINYKCLPHTLASEKGFENTQSKLNEALKKHNRFDHIGALKDLKKEIGTEINQLLSKSEGCAKDAKLAIDTCVNLYNHTLNPEIVSIYVNTCTIESLDQQVVEFYKYMNAPGSPAYSVNLLIQNHIKLRTNIAKLAEILIMVDEKIKELSPQQRVPAQDASEVPTS